MTPIQALAIIEDEISGKGGHTWIEVTEAGLVLGQYAMEQIKAAGGMPTTITNKTDMEHLSEMRAAIGTGSGLKNINWGNLLQIIIKVLGALGPVLGGAPVAGS